MSEGPTVIPLSRAKIVALVLGSFAFVAVSIWIWSMPEGQLPLRWLIPPAFWKVVSVAGTGFFSICVIFGCFKLFDQKPGLVIDAEGIVDNSSGIAAGRIFWKEIIGFSENEIFGQRFLTIEVYEPERFLKRSGALKAKLYSANTNLTGSPINISANTLSIEFDELRDILTRAFEFHNKAEQAGGDQPATRRGADE